MENLNLHKQKLYSLILAAAALVGIVLPWAKVAGYGGYGGGSVNGFHGEGFITLLGIGAVAVASFMGDKAKAYEGNFKYIAMGGFIGIIAGALLAFINVSSKGHGVIKPGMGIWLCIAAGAVGLLFLLGIVKAPADKTPPKA